MINMEIQLAVLNGRVCHHVGEHFHFWEGGRQRRRVKQKLSKLTTWDDESFCEQGFRMRPCQCKADRGMAAHVKAA